MRQGRAGPVGVRGPAAGTVRPQTTGSDPARMRVGAYGAFGMSDAGATCGNGFDARDSHRVCRPNPACSDRPWCLSALRERGSDSAPNLPRAPARFLPKQGREMRGQDRHSAWMEGGHPHFHGASATVTLAPHTAGAACARTSPHGRCHRPRASRPVSHPFHDPERRGPTAAHPLQGDQDAAPGA